jgi:type VI secretion system secreted protein VgrG
MRAALVRTARKEEPSMSRTFIAHSALGDQLQFRSMTGSERMGYLFQFQVNLLSEAEGISAKALLGTDLTVEVDLTTETSGGKRYLSGQVTAFTFAGKDGDYFAYQATLRPWLWLASRRKDFKIFQNMTVPDIVQDVLSKYGFAIQNKLCKSYRTWEYCVQYDESDFNFVSRLLETEGAYYYFAHQMGSHQLVLADDLGSHSPLPNGPTTIPYYPETRAAHVHDEDFVDALSGSEDIASGKYAADDYDFKKPKALLDTKQGHPAGHSQDSWEAFHWPGGYTDVGDGQNYANARMDQLGAERETVAIQGNARNIAPGYLFSLSRYPVGQYNKQYLVESASYHFTENVQRSDGAGAAGKRAGSDSPTTYRINTLAVPSSVSYRVQHHTQKPRTTGPQTAEVVGPPGEEIYTDQYGRVKVQFHWDRYGKKDQNSSCWIRVSSSWAGSNYGAIFTPRIGQEVIVDFLNGDPDYPIITGRVYNADQMPPWQLPDNKTQSGVKTRSSKGGTPGSGEKATPGTTNIIRFEDQAGQEQLWFHAQKDQLTEVEHDEDKWVGQDRRKVIDRDEFNTIHRDRTEIVDRNEKINVHGWRTEEVDLDETITIHQNRTEVVDWNEDVTIHQNQQHTVDINRTRKVGHNEKVTIGQNRVKTVGLTETDTIGILQTETVGMANIDTVGLVRMSNVGILYDLNVGLIMKTLVGISQSTSVGQTKDTTVKEKYTLTVGGNANLTMEPESITLKVGASSMVMKADGTIQLEGKDITVLASGKLNEQAGDGVLITGGPSVVVKAKDIDLN